MARLTVLTDLTGDITRAELFAMWKDATFTPITQEDFASDQFVHESSLDFRAAPSGESLVPGQIYYHRSDQWVYCYHDEIENTGVSRWLAIGPDRFDTACLCAEPIPAGAAVQPFYDRWVKVFDPSSDHPEVSKPIAPIGICQTGIPDSWQTRVGAVEGTTNESGTWITVAIEGFCMGWFPAEDSGVSGTHFGALPFENVGGERFFNHVGVVSGDRVTGGLGQPNATEAHCDNQIGYATYTITASSGVSNGYHRIMFTGLLRRAD